MNDVPVDPDVQDPTRAGGSGRGSGRPSGLTYLIGGILLVGVIALPFVVVLILGGLALIGYGVYIGIRARRGWLPHTEPATIPTSTQAHEPSATTPLPQVIEPTVFGREPSYGLGAACVLVGFVLVIVGGAMVDSPDSQTQAGSATPGAPASTPLPAETSSPTTNREPTVAAPVLPSSPVPTTTTAARAAAPAAPEQRADSPTAQVTVRPQPVAPRPAAPLPAAPQEDNDSSGGEAAYYQNCDAARAAGAAPIKRGEPGYRSGLDRDNDGIACDKK